MCYIWLILFHKTIENHNVGFAFLLGRLVVFRPYIFRVNLVGYGAILVVVVPVVCDCLSSTHVHFWIVVLGAISYIIIVHMSGYIKGVKRRNNL